MKRTSDIGYHCHIGSWVQLVWRSRLIALGTLRYDNLGHYYKKRGYLQGRGVTIDGPTYVRGRIESLWWRKRERIHKELSCWRLGTIFEI